MSGDTRVTVAVLQAALGADDGSNSDRIEALVREAVTRGAQVVLPPELFEGPYFCKQKIASFLELARPAAGHPTIDRFSALARELEVVVPVSFFEADGSKRYNSVAVIDADGAVLGIYRKSHIPDGAGYEEKFYFSPGDTGFRVWSTRYAKVGVGICWDQWFPECAREMVLAGADLLLYPSTIGSEPAEPELETKDPWQRVMTGQAVANTVPLAAANRTGCEDGQDFYGHSFIVDHRGEKLAELGRHEQGVATASIDLAEVRRDRLSFGLLADRRPELYGRLSGPADTTPDARKETP